jgi:aspartokinase-like uncharacterized kinase
VIVKVGGSLFDLDDLGSRLGSWLTESGFQEVLFVPGGGPFANIIRQLDHRHHLGEEKSHWLAVASLSVAARFLATIVPRAVLASDWRDCTEAWRTRQIPVLDPYRIMSETGDFDCLPCSWKVTSDSLAARIALITKARLLILLKSMALPEGLGWLEAGRRGYVDPCFVELVDGSFDVRFVNFRQAR